LVHPKILAKYEEAKQQYNPSAHDLEEKLFYQLCKGRPIKSEINSMYRIRLPSGEEFLYYSEVLIGTDHVGNEKRFTQIVGRYEEPVFFYRYNPETNTQEAVEILRHKTVYEISWSKEKFDELTKKLAESPNFYVVAARKYAVPTMEQFRDLTFDQLVELGKTGKVTATSAAVKGGK
jgi:hypothetical protein